MPLPLGISFRFARPAALVDNYLTINSTNMFDWFKKKTRRPLENVRAEGLEAVLNGNKWGDEDCRCDCHPISWRTGKPVTVVHCFECSGTGEFRVSESAPGKDAQGQLLAQEAAETVSTIVEKEAQRLREQIDACWCPVCKSRLWLDREESGFVLRLPTTQTDSLPVFQGKRISSHKTETRPDERHVMEVGRKYPTHERQTESETSGGSEGRGISECLFGWGRCEICRKYRELVVLDNHTESPQHPSQVA